MKAEELFLAIGSLGENRLEKTEGKNSGHSGGKLGRLLLAAVIATALIGTAFAAVGFLLYDNPAQMIQGLYGEHTGFDKEEPSLVSDPQKPWPNVMVQPGYENPGGGNRCPGAGKMGLPCGKERGNRWL